MNTKKPNFRTLFCSLCGNYFPIAEGAHPEWFKLMSVPWCPVDEPTSYKNAALLGNEYSPTDVVNEWAKFRNVSRSRKEQALVMFGVLPPCLCNVCRG